MRTKTFTLIVMLLYIIGVQAQTSKVNVTIDGPGVVDEYLTTSADGKKQVKLKAIPSKFLGNVTFDGWSGDATGTSEELTVDADMAQNIQATFTYHRPVKQYPLIDLKKSWADMGKPLYFEMPTIWETQDNTLWRGTNYLPVDYNRDGYIDYVQFPKKGGMGTDNHRENVRFWLGKPDGSFEEDPKNDNRMQGTVYSVIMKYADFNDDGYPDFCSFSTGYDRAGSTGDYPVILMSDENCVYHDLRYPKYQEAYNSSYGCFHGGTIGDFDNDGDIDILFWNQNDSFGSTTLYLENDGKGNFTERKGSDILDMTVLASTMPDKKPPFFMDCEVTDLNNDGYNDLIMCGNDHDLPNPTGYCSPPIVFWGSNSGKFGGTDYSFLPKPRLGYGITSALVFYDFNGDGIKEIIVDKNGDGVFGNSRFYVSGYLQVCEWENGEYVDKTEKYIPVEHQAFNKARSECRISIENIDGTDYLVTYEIDGIFKAGVGDGGYIPYAVRNGVFESLESEIKTKISSYDEGLPIYVDGPLLFDVRSYNDGVNPVDTMAEHHWVGLSDWDAPNGNLWRINMAHRKDTHFGRTCIRWNRDGQDPKKDNEEQRITFSFYSEVNIQKLADEGYYLEFYIKNSDPDLTLVAEFITHNDQFDPETFRGVSTTISNRHVVEGKFTGEWQRVLVPLSAFNGNGDFSNIVDFRIAAQEGNLNNEFFLDDIRIRKIADSSSDDYDRAFIMNYLEVSYINKERTAQVRSQEFKSMLKVLIDKFSPDSINYFNSYITDEDIPLTRGIATIMAYYTARCIGAETGNIIFGETPADMWDTDFMNYDKLLPHWNDLPETVFPEDKYWRGEPFRSWQAGWWWNNCHVSDYSGINVIALDKEVNSFHMNDPFTWENAICAITRLYDSLDPEKVAAGISTLKITPDSQSGVYYNLQGQRVENPLKGIYIKNGKKIICK